MKEYENIENYFDGNMTPEEMENFEELVSSNPELKAEFDFQKDIIDNIKEARKADLKAQLDLVSIPSAGTATGVVSKIISGAVIIGGIGYSVYYFNTMPPPEFDKQKEKELITQEDEINESIGDQITSTDEPSQEPVESKVEQTNERQIQSPEPVAPDVIEEFSDEEENNDLEMPEADLSTSVGSISTGVSIEINDDPEFNFHYKFEKNNLFLYGRFNDDIYEILENKDPVNGGLFLYFKEKFYRLDKTNQEIMPLEEITDQETNRRLEEIKNK